MRNNNMKTINSDQLKQILTVYAKGHGTTLAAMSRDLGFADSYLNNVLYTGKIRTGMLKALESFLGVDLQCCIIPDDMPETEMPKAWDVQWAVNLDTSIAKVVCLKNGEEAYHGLAKILDANNEVSVLQAISYAAHICYKKAEQAYLEARR